MDPPPEEMAKWTGLGDIMGWIKLADPEDPQSAGGSLLTLLGAEASTPIMLLGSIGQEAYDEIIKTWRPGGQAPTPIQASQAALLGRSSRIASRTEMSSEELRIQQQQQKETELKQKELEIKLAAEAAANAANNNTGQNSASQATKKKIKMSTVADQINDQEIDVLDDDKISKCYASYHTIFKDIPPEGEECTIEQLTALHELIKSGAPPLR